MSEFEFHECSRCGGYGVRDNGKNCTNCGGKGRGGLLNPEGQIGSGEIIIERATGRQLTTAQYIKLMEERDHQPELPL